MQTRKILPVEAPGGGACAFNVVRLNKLDSLAMGEAMILCVEIAPLIHDRLRALVIDHRIHAVLIGQRKIEKFQLDGNCLSLTVSSDRNLPPIQHSRQIAVYVDLDPYRLVLCRLYPKRKAASASLSVLWH